MSFPLRPKTDTIRSIQQTDIGQCTAPSALTNYWNWVQERAAVALVKRRQKLPPHLPISSGE